MGKEASARRVAARAARGVAWTLLALCLLALVVAVGVPLVVRGPVLARLVAYGSKDLCGTVRVTGGHASLSLAPALLFQRPFEVVLDGTRIREPDGSDLFRARTVRVRLSVHRQPWRVVVERAFVSDGAWRLVAKGEDQPLTAALREIPPAGRDACVVAEPPRPPPRGRPSASLVTIEAATLQRLSIELAFGTWGVALADVNARGTLDVRTTPDGTQVLFDARDVVSRAGGTLRIGPRNPSTPRFPFDRVSIPRVAVTADAPPDLLLTVAEARTGDAVLSGRARFTNVFAPDAWHVSAGMILTARWTDLGVPLQRNAAWAEVGKGLARQRAGLRTDLRGPFDALTGAAVLEGRQFWVRADLLPRGRYKADVRFDDFDTTPFVPKEGLELLAGRLAGRASVSARLGASAADAAASLDTIELQLQRTRADPTEGRLPTRWVVSRSFRAPARGELRLDLGKVAYAGGALQIDAFRVAAPPVVFAGRLRTERPSKSGALRVRLWPAPDTRFAWGGEAFRPPPVIAARVEPGRAVTVEPFSIAHVGGGALEAGGTLRFDGRADVEVAVRSYPLARIPMLAAVRAPMGDAAVGALLGGRLDARLAVAVRAQRLSLSGMVALSRVAWSGHAVGGGRIELTGLRGGTRFAGQLLDGVDLRGTLHLPLAPEDEVTLGLRRFALRPWLPASVAPLAPRVSGDLRWRPGERGRDRGATGEELRLSDFAVSARGAEATAAGVLRIDRRDLRASAVSATLNARVAGPALARALYPKITGAGSAGVDVTLAGTIGAPELRGAAQFRGLTASWRGAPFGAVRLDGPVRFEGRSLAVGPLAAGLQSGGRLRIGGARGGSGTIVLARPGASLPVSAVDLAVRATGVSTAHPVGGLSVRGLALDVRLSQANAATLRADGWVYLGHDFFRLNEGKEEEQPPERAPAPRPSLADHVLLHLRLVGPEDAVTVGVPYLPDVTIGANCSIEGSLASPQLSGRVQGSNLYARAALAIADGLTSRDLRGCDLGPD